MITGTVNGRLEIVNYADNIPQLISDCGFTSWKIGSAISGDRSVVLGPGRQWRGA
jgi:hypothetical protein